MATVEPLDPYTSVDPNQLIVRAPFTELFLIDASIRSKITESMRAGGYDPSKPINIWRQEKVVIDGHTRRLAAIDAGLTSVPICFHDFADEDEAMKYAIANQRDRRNITQAKILRCIEAVDKRKKQGGRRGNQYTGGKPSHDDLAKPPFGGFAKPHSVRNSTSASVTAKIVGVPTKTVENARRIIDHAKVDPKPLEDVLSGKMKISKAARLVPTRRGKRLGDDTTKAETKAKPEPKHVPVIPPPRTNGRSAEVTRVPTAEEQAWLESIPLRARVIAHRFDEDALLYRGVQVHLKSIRESLKTIVGTRSPVAAGPLYLKMQNVSGINPPDRWDICPACNCDAHVSVCKRCRGCGYVIT